MDGGGSTAAAAAAQPYVAWLTTTAAAAEQAGAQAAASAAAYEAAFTGVVPPPVIAANRTLLQALVATNFLGINTPAIMATEAHYAEMWVQDAVTMNTYQVASMAAAALQPLTPAAPTTNPAAAATQGAAVSTASANATASPAARATGILGNLTSVLNGEPSGRYLNVAGALGLQTMLSDLDGLIGTPLLFNGFNGGVNTAAWFVMNAIPTAVSLGHTLGAAAPAAAAADAVASCGRGGGSRLAGSVTPLGLGGARRRGWARRARSAACRCRQAGRAPSPRPPSARRPPKAAAGPSPPRKPHRSPRCPVCRDGRGRQGRRRLRRRAAVRLQADRHAQADCRLIGKRRTVTRLRPPLSIFTTANNLSTEIDIRR